MRRALDALIVIGLSISLSACSADPPSQADTDGRPQNGIGWNGIGWNGIGWNGVGFNNLGVTPDWGLGGWVNDPSVGPTGREERLNGLAYWASCACGASDVLKWKGANPYTSPPSTETRYFQGSFDLAPTWCRGTGPVPHTEFEAVSACLLARVNTMGIHNALSLRGFENSLALSDNEKLFMSYPEAQYWGNIWNTNPTFQDPSSGFFYKNTRAFACYFPTGTGASMLLSDLAKLVGRTCEFDGCGGGAHTSRECATSGSIDGAYSQAHADSAATIPIGWTPDPAIAATGANNSAANDYQDTLTGTQKATFYQRDWRRLSVFLGAWADLETANWKDAGYQCDSACPPSDGCSCYDRYCQGREGTTGNGLQCEQPSFCNNCQTIVRHPGWACGYDATCKAGDCVRDQKLAYLSPGCWLTIQFTRPFDLVSGTQVSGNANPHKAGTLLFRYAHVGAGPAAIQVQDQIRGRLIPSGVFDPTGSTDLYQNKMIYPVYPGRAVFSGTLPGIEIAISGDPSYAFPQLDYAQIFAGPPPDTKPRELYWSTKAMPFNVGDTVCASIKVSSTSEIVKVGQVRMRPSLSGTLLEKEDITLEHEGVVVRFNADVNDAPWSQWSGDFDGQPSMETPWQLCIHNANATGTIDAADIEIEKP